MTEEWQQKAEEHSLLASGIKSSYLEGAKHFKKKVIEMLENKLHTLWMNSEENLREKKQIINDILYDIYKLKP